MPDRDTHRTQEERILWQLQSAYPNWTPAPVLSRISLQYNARIFSLRRKGWQIASKVETRDGVKHGSFRFATPGTWPNPKCKSVTAASSPETFPQFGNIAADRSYAE